MSCSAQRTAPTGPSPATREVVIEQGARALVLVVGQTLVARSETDAPWMATVDTSVLAAEPTAPNQDGGAATWKFRAVKSGETEITLTLPSVAACPNPPNCPPPPAPRTVPITVRVQPRTP